MEQIPDRDKRKTKMKTNTVVGGGRGRASNDRLRKFVAHGRRRWGMAPIASSIQLFFFSFCIDIFVENCSEKLANRQT